MRVFVKHEGDDEYVEYEAESVRVQIMDRDTVVIYPQDYSLTIHDSEYDGIEEQNG